MHECMYVCIHYHMILLLQKFDGRSQLTTFTSLEIHVVMDHDDVSSSHYRIFLHDGTLEKKDKVSTYVHAYTHIHGCTHTRMHTEYTHIYIYTLELCNTVEYCNASVGMNLISWLCSKLMILLRDGFHEIIDSPTHLYN